MRVTDDGVSFFNGLILPSLASIHLFTSEGGELEGHGYAPIDFASDRWNMETGLYEGVRWNFAAGDRVAVAGYFIKGVNGKVVLIRDFDEPVEIEHRGDYIALDIMYQFNRSQVKTALQ